MIRTYSDAVNAKHTPQTEPIPGSSQIPNSAGGYSYAVDDWKRLERFLILGSEGGSYYATERALTLENATCVERCIKADGVRAVELVAQVSNDGRAPKNDPAIFALVTALKKGDEAARRAAGAHFSTVVRTGTHLFQAAEMVKAIGGWGRGTKRAFTRWYESKKPDQLALQLVKYQQREGWSHRDILRKVHAPPSALLKYAAGKGMEPQGLPGLIYAAEQAKTARGRELIGLIREYHLPRECVPTEALNDVAVWDALLTAGRGMPINALVRNLAKMTSIGLLTESSEATRYVELKLRDLEQLKGSRLHPLNILTALRTYSSGHGLKGSLSWSPVRRVADALDDAFYESFKTIEPSGKRIMIALDVSGSMHGGQVGGSPLTPAEASVALALVAMNTERDVALYGFGGHFQALPISKRDRLDSAVRKIQGMNFGTTDCSLPMKFALSENARFDVFQVYTDSETYAGAPHPSQAIKAYRGLMKTPAKLVVVGMVSNGFSIADPNDAGMMDVVGFDTATPSLIADFSRN